LYRAFEESVMDEHALEGEGFKGPWVKTFIEVARENIIPPHVTIDGYVEATDFCPDGAIHIKEALAKAAMESDGLSVKVQYIGAPRYRLVVKAPDYKTAEEEIQKAAARVIKVVTAKGGEAKFHRKDLGDALDPQEVHRVRPLLPEGRLPELRSCDGEPDAAAVFSRGPLWGVQAQT